MCRMFCLAGNYGSDFPSISRAFKEITEKDPIITSKEGDFTSHDDGWGYVHHRNHGLDYYRSADPVFKSEFPDFEKGNLVVHARKAAPKEPMGTSSCHPHFEMDERYEVFLSHNGWFDKYALARELGEKNPEKYVDSQMFLKYMMSFTGNLEDRLRTCTKKAKENEYIKSSANLMILALDRDSQKSQIYCYTDVAEGKEYTEYITLYEITEKNWKGIFSSSILVPEYLPGKSGARKIARGTVVSL